jgi:hypothetical protein
MADVSLIGLGYVRWFEILFHAGAAVNVRCRYSLRIDRTGRSTHATSGSVSAAALGRRRLAGERPLDGL